MFSLDDSSRAVVAHSSLQRICIPIQLFILRLQQFPRTICLSILQKLLVFLPMKSFKVYLDIMILCQSIMFQGTWCYYYDTRGKYEAVAKMYYFPKKENSLGRENTLKFAWDRISGIHCLLLPQHSDICLGNDITYSLFTSSPPKTLDELSHVGSRTPEPVRYISIKKKKLLVQKFLKMDDLVCHHDKLGY